MTITHAAHHYRVGSGATALFDTMNAELARVGRPPVPVPNEAATADKAAAVHAYVNDGRWIATCPDCNESQVVSTEDHRLFCFMCLNAEVGGRFRPVIFPHDRKAIEAELDSWPAKLARHWNPGDSLATLRTRVAEHTRPSVPRLEDLAAPDAKRLTKLLATEVDGAKLPRVEWADTAQTKPKVTFR